MHAVRERFDQLCRNGQVFGPVNDLAIAEAETELGVYFPTEYRELLGRYGAVLAKGIEVYGLPAVDEQAPPLWQNVVDVTKQLREWGQAGAEQHHFIPICDDGTAVYFYLDTSVSPLTKIRAFGAGIAKVFDVSLFEFLVALADGKIRI